MKANGRDHLGRFTIGHAGGPGRPPIERERRYVETLTSTVSDDDWERICIRAIQDAKAGDHRAREWLSKYLLGDPQHVSNSLHLHQHLNGTEDSKWLEDAPPESIIQFLASVRRLKASCKVE